ncbi:hypothetical protein [Jatrophihabitans sp.]|uniref:hypothetical protein n=1 Tax=Jatrophihabitans sp. TaxID=1932789 RepID=UPI002C9814A8|nr:hypothetical protein [Jatrophihabitans sp.]
MRNAEEGPPRGGPEHEGGPGFGPGRGHRGPGGPRRGGPRGGGFGRPGGWQQAELPPADDAADWFTGRLPSDWFTGPASVSVDREEIIVVGELPPVGSPAAGEEPAGAQSEAAAAGRISRFREDTRAERMKIAAEAEARYGRKVAWGAQLGSTRVLFTHLSVPVMTRLRQPERQVLDTLVDAGVARSRSEALAWAVNLVGQHTEEWLASLREAMSEVDKLRAQGPDL